MQTRYVNTASTAGGDGTTNGTSGATRAYATLREFIDSLAATLTDAYTCYCDGSGGPDTGDVNQAPWDFVTSPTNYVLITAVGSMRATMPWNASAYRLEATNRNGCYSNSSSHIRVDGIQIQVTVNNAGSYVALKLTNANQTVSDVDMRASNCVIRAVQTSGSVVGVTCSAPTGAGTGKAWNCIVYDCNQGFESVTTVMSLYNCTAVNCTYSYVADAAFTVINCIGKMTGGIDFVNPFSASSNYNASSDGVAPGANSRVNQTFSFVDAAGKDFHLLDTDAGARTFGVHNPSSGLFRDDIDLRTRGYIWDIGAHQVTPGPSINYTTFPKQKPVRT